jgi:hypothetical protein
MSQHPHKHTREPWAIHPNAAATIMSSRNYDEIVHLGLDADNLGRFENEHDARRAVACVNACAGFTTEAIEKQIEAGSGIIRAFQVERDALKKQRDELLATLKKCDEAMEYMSEHVVPLTLPERVKEAIAKAEAA